jgi:hypothetical protein
MAVVSGIAGRTSAAVHRFCEQEQIPCLLPNVDLPVMGDGDFYSVYYSAGVLLEAELMAVKLPDGGNVAEMRDAVGIGERIHVRSRESRCGDNGAGPIVPLSGD